MVIKKRIKKCSNCKRRQRAKNRTICECCRSRKRRAADPLKAAYGDLKSNAKRRGKPFTITFSYFKLFCHRTDYIKGKGRFADNYTVDRIIEELGYVPGNIQKMKNGDNVRKYLEYCWQTKEAKVITDKRSKDFLF